jgi:hypothetical protein
MELPKIFSKLTTTQDNSRETFLALEIAPETVKSAVWAVEGKKTVVIKIGSVEEWEEDKEDSLIEAVDRSISNAGEGLSPEPNKVILGLLSSWVKDDQIAENRRALLKNVCSKLELKPLGFVVNLEALIAHIKEEEGTPVSAIFINLSETQSLISLVQLGKLKGTHAVGRSEDLAADVREGLARFGEIENLPSRMILFDGIADFEEAKQQLMSFDWQKYLKFIHFPKVESLEVAASIKAVAIAGGAEVAKSLGFTIAEVVEEKTANKEEKTIVTEKEKKTAVGTTETELETELTADDLGFISEKDIAHLKKTATEDESSLEKPTKNSILGRKTDKQVETKESTALETVAEEALKRKPFHLQRPVSPVKKSLSLLLKPFSAVGQFLSQRKISVVIVPLIFLAVMAALGFAFYWYVPKATVNLYFKPQVLEKEFSITFDSGVSNVDKDNDVIPATFKDVEVDSKKIKEVTGQKLIGEKAKGEVTIYNKSDVTKTFTAGTVLISSSKLTFTLDNEVKVASKSAQQTAEGEQVTYGKATASLTAQSIGTESNLASQSELSFKDYPLSVYSAKTDKGFSGGLSREVKAVSKDDMDSLFKDLSGELESKAQTQLKSQLSSEEDLLNKIVSSSDISKKFSASEDEEADNLGLDLKTKFTFLVYKKDNLNQFLKTKLADNAKSGFMLDQQAITIEVKDIALDGHKAETRMAVKTSLLPSIDTEEVKNNIKGRYPVLIESYLASLPNFTRADIKISPPLPAKLSTLPRVAKNIKVEVRTEE